MYGMMSDCQPIFNMRRKPYFVIGWIIYVICNFWLTFLGSPDIGWLVGLVSPSTSPCNAGDHPAYTDSDHTASHLSVAST